MDTGQSANWAAGGRPVPGVAVSALVAADNAHRRRTEMGKIIVSENVTLDGVVQDPAGDEGFRHGGWVGRIGGPGGGHGTKGAPTEAMASGARLLGPRRYE